MMVHGLTGPGLCCNKTRGKARRGREQQEEMMMMMRNPAPAALFLQFFLQSSPPSTAQAIHLDHQKGVVELNSCQNSKEFLPELTGVFAHKDPHEIFLWLSLKILGGCRSCTPEKYFKHDRLIRCCRLRSSVVGKVCSFGYTK
jgi:hypothetical protein